MNFINNTRVTTEIDVKALKAELADWEKMKEPSEEELIAEGMIMHPYYSERENRIRYLKERIKEVEGKNG